MKKNEGTTPIGFRLATSFAKRLADDAANRHMSRHELARQLVIEGLLIHDEMVSIREELTSIRRDIGQLRSALARSVVALLADAGNAEADEAEDWVRQNLLT